MRSSNKKKNKKKKPPIVYRDGFGNVIPNIDLEMQEKLKEEIKGRFERHLEYEGNLRAGNVLYIEGKLRISFSNEVGGGNCMVYIDIPSDENWEAQTNTPLSRRKDILEFVAATVQMQQASNCRYEIRENTISFYYK